MNFHPTENHKMRSHLHMPGKYNILSFSQRNCLKYQLHSAAQEKLNFPQL